MLKILIATAIISLGISGAAYFVMYGPPALVLVPSLDSQPTTQQTNNNPVRAGQPLVENWQSLEPSESNLSIPGVDRLEEENLTEEINRNIAKIIMENNPDGPQTVDGELQLNVPDPEELAAQVLAEAATKFDPESLKPTIHDSDLIISQDNSKEALIQYFFEINKIVSDSAQEISSSVPNNSENDWLVFVYQLTDAYQESADKFYKLSVPESALEIHKKAIQLLGAKGVVFEKMKNYEGDPITAILALKYLDDLDIQFQNLQEETMEFVKNNNLDI